jgi:hypothetical protein
MKTSFCVALASRSCACTAVVSAVAMFGGDRIFSSLNAVIFTERDELGDVGKEYNDCCLARMRKGD